MLIEKAKSLVPVIDELVCLSDNGRVSNSHGIRALANKLEYEVILILQSIMYIGQQEHKPDNHMKHLDSYYESGFESTVQHAS